MATEATERRGMRGICCPLCGKQNALCVHVADSEIRCLECDCTLTVEELEERVNGWADLCKWVRTLPFRTYDTEE